MWGAGCGIYSTSAALPPGGPWNDRKASLPRLWTMRCPYCREINQDKVIDSRLSENGQVIRRRRLCTVCGKRFTTKERIENEIKLTVIKRDGRRSSAASGDGGRPGKRPGARRTRSSAGPC